MTGLSIAVTPPAGVMYAEIAMSGATAYAVDSNGNVRAWGWDVQGQVDNGVKENDVFTPCEALAEQGVTQISGTAQDVVVFS
ncbi:MAG TPA: hypothetical protein VI434_12195 [Candidatus Dormibacteraeota bacterium]